MDSRTLVASCLDNAHVKASIGTVAVGLVCIAVPLLAAVALLCLCRGRRAAAGASEAPGALPAADPWPRQPPVYEIQARAGGAAAGEKLQQAAAKNPWSFWDDRLPQEHPILPVSDRDAGMHAARTAAWLL